MLTLLRPFLWHLSGNSLGVNENQRTSTKYCILLLADLQMSTRSLAKAFIHRLRTHHATHEEGRRVTTTATVALLQSQLDNNA